jgi:hypothetical protein
MGIYLLILPGIFNLEVYLEYFSWTLRSLFTLLRRNA